MCIRDSYSELVQKDLSHWVHPQYHKADHGDPVLADRAEGAYIYGHDGTRYFDGLSGLWNAAVGHGRPELAQAAAEAITRSTWTNNYVGFSNEAAIELAAKVVSLSYDYMQGGYYTNSGSESNETNFKAARFYWSIKGKPEKNKIISRVEAYHGNTLATMSAKRPALMNRRPGTIPCKQCSSRNHRATARAGPRRFFWPPIKSNHRRAYIINGLVDTVALP